MISTLTNTKRSLYHDPFRQETIGRSEFASLEHSAFQNTNDHAYDNLVPCILKFFVARSFSKRAVDCEALDTLAARYEVHPKNLVI
jgi:hypothetical protein